jgi:peptidoglycan/LPS O-acetylase OafA/YrhL
LTPALSNFIALARWVAAALVLVGHAGAIINISDIMVAPHGPGVYAWWFSAAFFHQAVLVFFVISGFLVGGPLLRDRARQAPFLQKYLIDRFSRIYIVMVPALVWTFLIDWIGRKLFPATGLYDAPFFAGVFDLKNYFWTLLQQQHLWASQAGTNGPLWSLACEMWYYIIFPLLLLPYGAAYSRRARVAGCALGVGLTLLMTTPETMALLGVDVAAMGLTPMLNHKTPMFIFGFGVWALGAWVRVAPRALIRSAGLSLALFLVVAVVTRLAVRGPLIEAHPLASTFADAAVGATFANLLLTLRFVAAGGLFSRLHPIHWRLSDFSYSLYATHAPLVFFVWAAVGGIFDPDWYKRLPTPTHWAIALSLMVVAIAFAYVFSRATEARTTELRDFLRGALLKKKTRPRVEADAPL